MPHGALFRGGAEKEIRKGLIRRGLFDSVIGLPGNLFYSTGIPACLLIFRNQAVGLRPGKILFIDGSNQFAKGRNQNSMTSEHVERIIRTYCDPSGSAGLGVPSAVVDVEEVEANDWDINIGRYIQPESSLGVSVEEAIAALRQAQLEANEAGEQLARRLKAAGYA